MKIKKLILENINSLYGRWTIDFEDPAFSEGLFAIMGPTGSGKTTILDAICLALYAETPRIRGRGVRTVEVVSKGAAGCLAELTFEIDGKIYLASFGFSSFRRGLRRGTLLDKPVHTLSCEGRILSEKLTETKARILEITGMKADQFYRAVLLAQGQFDAFLLAGEEKADILEQITGTAIYSEIARKIHEKNVQTGQQILLAETEQTSSRILSPEAERQKQEELSALNQQLAVRLDRKRQLEDFRRLFDRVARVTAYLHQNAQEVEQLNQQKELFAPEAVRLAAAEKAARILPAFLACSELEKIQCSDQEKMRILLEKQPEEQQALVQKKQLAAAAEKELRQVQEENTRLEQRIRQTTLLDHETLRLQNQLTALEEQLKNENQSRKDLLAYRTRLREEENRLEAEKRQAEQYQQEHRGDETLPERKVQWLEQLKNLQIRNKELSVREQEYREAAEAEKKAVRERENRQILLTRCDAELLTARQTETEKAQVLAEVLNGTTREALEHEQEILMRNLTVLRKILSYEEARKTLKDHEPCPLCGSREHPFAQGSIPEISRDEADLAAVRKRLKAGSDAENALQEATRACEQKIRERLEAEKNWEFAAATVGQKQEVLEKIRTARELLRQDLQQQSELIRQSLEAQALEWNGHAVLPPEIEQRILAWRDAAEKLQSFATTKKVLESNLTNLVRQEEESTRRIELLMQQKDSMLREQRALRTERMVLFGERNPEQESERARKKLEAAGRQLTGCNREVSSMEEAVRIHEQNIRMLKEAVEQRESELRRLRTEFLTACAGEEMSPESFDAARLPEAELTRLSGLRARLSEREQTLALQQRNLKAEQEILQKQLTENLSPETASAELTALQLELDAAQQKIGALKNELAVNAELRRNQAELREKLLRLHREKEIWAELDAMIGGANGQRFQRIAQGITLDQLLGNANEVLQRLNGRYELLRGEEENDPLGIDVIDHWQGDEIRTCANLSGGERFQVSLALALGLSAMAGEKIRIDSLFLDEGFGTLDPASLESALQMLSGLRRSEGKTIGIISHVQAIGENLPALIEVIPAGGGRSRLSGAGIRSE